MAWPQEQVSGGWELPFHWLLPLSCWYLLCTWGACSNKGRCIPPTQTGTQPFPMEPPSDACPLFPPVSLGKPPLLDLYGGACYVVPPLLVFWLPKDKVQGIHLERFCQLGQTRILCFGPVLSPEDHLGWSHVRATVCQMFSVCPCLDLGPGEVIDPKSGQDLK